MIRNRKLILTIVLLTVITSTVFLYAKCIKKHPNVVMVVISKEYEGKILIFFDKSNYPPLKEDKLGYFAPIKNGVLITSTSLSDIENIHFYLVRLDYEKKLYFHDSTSVLLNYSKWYSGKPNEKLNNYLKSEEFYVGYFYKQNYHSSEDSLKQFLKSINGDTTM